MPPSHEICLSTCTEQVRSSTVIVFAIVNGDGPPLGLLSRPPVSLTDAIAKPAMFGIVHITVYVTVGSPALYSTLLASVVCVPFAAPVGPGHVKTSTLLTVSHPMKAPSLAGLVTVTVYVTVSPGAAVDLSRPRVMSSRLKLHPGGSCAAKACDDNNIKPLSRARPS